MAPLNQVHPFAESGASVCVGWELASDRLVARFEVEGSQLVVNPDPPRGRSAWGLWETDVVEIFVRARAAEDRYFEFQVSPLGQHFELEIFEPRKRFNQDYASGGVFEAQTAAKGWSARIEVPLRALEWDGHRESLVGGAFACLGPKEARTYWGLWLPKQEKPDFHLPEHFRRLF